MFAYSSEVHLNNMQQMLIFPYILIEQITTKDNVGDNVCMIESILMHTTW